MLPAILLTLALAPQTAPPGGSPLKSADVAPSGGQAFIDAGLAAFRKRRFGKAEIEFRKAVEADPGSAAATFYLGYTYYKMGERRGRNNESKQKAKDLFSKAFELDPRFQPVWGQSRKK